MIKILSGWSNPGGSTTAFVNLTNLFNNNNISCCFYGPHTWHLDKCNAKTTSSFFSELQSDDVVICHFVRFPSKNRPLIKKFIFSCHEQHIFPLKKINYKIYDKIHFVSEHQKQFQNISHPSFIIPNVLDDLKPSTKVIDKKIGGIIGSIDRNKQTHISIKNALNNGCDRIYLYGNITDKDYFEKYVSSLIDNDKVVYKGYYNVKQAIYDEITDVYHYSKNESWGYIKAEAQLTKKIYHGNNQHTVQYWTHDQILSAWKNELEN